MNVVTPWPDPSPAPHNRRNGLLKLLEVRLDNLLTLAGSPLQILPSTEQTYLAKLLPFLAWGQIEFANNLSKQEGVLYPSLFVPT